MTNNKKGFTLIELLVVVLIIGILSAIALPNYTRTVEKSRSAEAMINLKAISDAANRYYLMNNSYAGMDISPTGNLDIEPPTANAQSKFDYATSGCGASTCTITGIRRGDGVTAAGGTAKYTFAYALSGGTLSGRSCTASGGTCEAKWGIKMQ